GSTTYTTRVSSNPEETAALEAQVRSLRAQAEMEAAQADRILSQRIQTLEQFAEAQPQFNENRMSLRVDALTLGAEETAPIAADFDGDGYFTETQWFGKAQAVLTLDLNADSHLRFDEMIDRDGLRLLDADGNESIDERDPAFRALRLWVDANRDAIADAGEARSLSELGIGAIDLSDDGLSGVRLRRVDGATEDFTQTQLDLAAGEGFQVRELAEGIGTLISTKGADGTIQDLVIGTNTREFDNDPLHRNSSDAGKKREEKIKVDAGDERLSGNIQEAYQAMQTLTRVADNDVRGVSGGAGIAILGQDSTQQAQTGPSSGDLYSIVAERSAFAFGDNVPPPPPREAVVVGDAPAPSLASPPSIDITLSSTLTGQHPQAQAEGVEPPEVDNTSTLTSSVDTSIGEPQVLSGQSAGQQTAQSLAHRPDRIRRSARTTDGTRANVSATAGSTSIILNKSDASILSAASTPAARPSNPERIISIPGATGQAQTATQEMQRAQQALIRSAETTLFGGNALGSAGLMAVGLGAASAQWPVDAMASTGEGIDFQGYVETGAQPSTVPGDATPSTHDGAGARLTDGGHVSVSSLVPSDNAAVFRPAQTVSQPASSQIAADNPGAQPALSSWLNWIESRDATPAFDAFVPSTVEPVRAIPVPINPPDATASGSTMGAGGARLQSPNPLTLKELIWQGSEDQRLLFDASEFVEADVDGSSDDVMFSDISAPRHGSVNLVNGKIVFVPEENYVGEAGFDYTVVNARGQLVTGSANLQIAAVNDAPQLFDEYARIEEDQTLLVSGSELLANDFDVDDEASTLQITAIGETHHLSAVLGSDGSISITPEVNYHGPASFSYTVRDPHGASSTAYARLDIAAVNDAPIAIGERTSTEEDTGLTFTPAQLLQNDQDPDIDTDADSLHISSVDDAQHGRAWIDDEGNIRFLPDSDYNGSAGFSYWVEDKAGARSRARVEIDVASINDAPRVLGEAASADEDTVLWFDPADLLDNDRDAEGDSLSIIAVGGARHGTVVMTVAPDGMHRIEFIPEPNYFGPASFDYTVADSAGATSTTTAYIDLAEVNDAPVAMLDERFMVEDQPHVVRAEDLLANDLDADGAALQEVHAVIDVHSAVHGSASLRDGEVLFTPDADYFGDAAFSYTLADGRGGTSQGQVILHVGPVNDAPVIGGESIASDEDQSLVIAASALLANDVDIDSDETLLRVSAVRNARHGEVSLQSDGSIFFVPEADYVGPAGFDYTVSDAEGGNSEASVALELTPLNDAPRPAGETLVADEDTPFLITPAILLENDEDVDSPHSALSLTAVGQGQHGQVERESDGSILFIPDPDYFGPASFEYTVSDDHGASSTQQVFIELQAVNDAPMLVGEFASANEDHVLQFSGEQLLQNDGDIDNSHDELGIVAVSDAMHGSAELDGLGGVRFTPELNYYGPAGFRYTVSDGSGGLSQVGVSVELQPVNDAPSVIDEVLAGQENQTLSVSADSLLANDTDVDNAHAELQLSWVGNAVGG
ncbi:MAG: tandem-95 repeat protein, partial [Burkholderiaceae bacterium]|nr:tandem-95 repeat protein [Burkholderiaceae bacterium]